MSQWFFWFLSGCHKSFPIMRMIGHRTSNINEGLLHFGILICQRLKAPAGWGWLTRFMSLGRDGFRIRVTHREIILFKGSGYLSGFMPLARPKKG
jgi:hypothetical protein